MRVMSAMPKTEISVEDGCVVIGQCQDYRTATVKIPIEVWDMLCDTVVTEMNDPLPVVEA